MTDSANMPQGIAIVGMAGRFPGARTVDDFWDAVKAGRDCITRFDKAQLEIRPTDTDEPNFVCAKGVLDDVDQFDARFFGYLPKEAEVMDPQHRVFLEICWEAVEHAGYDTSRYAGSIGVFGGCYMDTYLLHNLCSDDAFRTRLVESIQVGTLQTELGNDKDYLATRVAFKMGLRGPAMTLQTACSTSLVAIATACQSLETFSCDMALAGGVTIVLPQFRGYSYKEGGMLSPDGHCRPFDAKAAGTVFSNGAAVLLLKRLEDAIHDGDTIYAVIGGYATNNDGATKLSYTAPSIDGQAEVISQALGMAGFDARSMGYVEAHGTATPLGDPIEVAGLTKAYRVDTSDTSYCALGSVKANFGHLDVASGAIGTIKAALSIHEGIIPPTTHFESPNPKIDFGASPFFVPTSLSPWKSPDGLRRAGVSSFGVGGTNAHIVMEQAPLTAERTIEAVPQIFPLSAMSESALCRQATSIRERLASTSFDPADVAYTLQMGRKQFPVRACVVVDPSDDHAADIWSEIAPRIATAYNPPIVFVFPGQATQYPGMGRGLYHSNENYRATIDRVLNTAETVNPATACARKLLLWSEDSDIDFASARELLSSTDVAQVAIYATEVATMAVLYAWGVRPSAVIGHSVGEIAAAVSANVFDVDAGARLAATRGQLMASQPRGAMVAIHLSADEVRSRLSDGIVISAVNSPSTTIVSGSFAAIEAFEQEMSYAGIRFVRLETSHAFHSPMMEGARDALVRAAGDIRHAPLALPFISTLTGVVCGQNDLSGDYWGKQLMQQVRFLSAVEVAYREHPGAVFMEVGPGQVMSSLVSQIFGGNVMCTPTFGHPKACIDEAASLRQALGALWTFGVDVDWTKLHTGPRRRVPLPTYPFERQRHWVDAVDRAPGPAPRRETLDNVSAGNSGVEALVRQQLDIIAAQLETLRRKG